VLVEVPDARGDTEARAALPVGSDVAHVAATSQHFGEARRSSRS
jgi:hypothetical protein